MGIGLGTGVKWVAGVKYLQSIMYTLPASSVALANFLNCQPEIQLVYDFHLNLELKLAPKLCFVRVYSQNVIACIKDRFDFQLPVTCQFDLTQDETSFGSALPDFAAATFHGRKCTY